MRIGPKIAPTNEPVRTSPKPSARRLGGYMSAAATRSCCTAPFPAHDQQSEQQDGKFPKMAAPPMMPAPHPVSSSPSTTPKRRP